MMNPQLSYRDRLLASLDNLENSIHVLAAISLDLVFFEDRENHHFPFEDGDEIPFDFAVLDNSDIRLARILGDVIRQMNNVHMVLCNINNLPVNERPEVECSNPDEDEDDDCGFPRGNRETFEDLKCEAADYISHSMAFLLADCYFLIHGHDIPEDWGHDLYFPEKGTFDQLETEDTNADRLVALAKYLHAQRDAAWEEI